MFRVNSVQNISRALSGLGLILAAHSAWATVPSNPTEQCQIILQYEGMCGNKRPNSCLGTPGIDYFHNATQQNTWDNYWSLCVNVPGNTVDRYSHECIQALGIGATCTSTVPDLVEYHAVTTMQYTVMPFHEEPELHVATTMVATYCGMMSSTETTIHNYFLACGDVAAAQCSNSAAPISAFQTACGTKKPCECVAAFGCHTAYCPAPSTGSTPSGDSDPGSPPPPAPPPAEVPAPAPAPAPDAGTSTTPGETGDSNATGNNVDGNSFVLGAPGGEGGKSGANAADKPAGCALQPAATSTAGAAMTLFCLNLALLPLAGRRALHGRRFFHQR